MAPSLLILLLCGFAISAGLLWLAGEIGAAARARPALLASTLWGVAALLAVCGLWWPAHALRAPEIGAALPGIVAWLPAALLAVLAGTAWGVERVGALRSGRPRLVRNLRRGVGALAAAAVCAAAGLALPRSGAPRLAPGSAWLLMLGLIAVSGVLLQVLRQTSRPPPGGAPRTSRAANIDSLTGLPTRLHFETQLAAAAVQCNLRGKRMAVLFIDLDGFKPINDSFGHTSGDRVIAQIAARLQTLANGPRVVARIGGDQFLMLAFGIQSTGQVETIATRVIDSLSQPCQLDDNEVGISCSVGVAIYPDTHCQANKLIARADAAKAAAKRAGGSRHCFYSPEMDADVRHNFELLRDLRRAVPRDELELFFQPKIDAKSGKVTAAEALVRWNHPTRGLLMPGEFVPLAERSGVIGPLGDWVIEAGCKQARAWRDKGLRMRVAINLSAFQMRQGDIAERIAGALKRHRIHPSLLTCEITESAAMEDTAATQNTFRRLGELGAHLSIDDFGTGYSSLAYLRQLPAEELKIDASFVKDVDHSADARAVVDAVVRLAHALGLKVVAEGVETVRQRRVLLELGCDEFQGFLFARPMTARALLLWAMDDRAVSAVFRDSLFADLPHESPLSQMLPLPP